jgi:hypothetical protein
MVYVEFKERQVADTIRDWLVPGELEFPVSSLSGQGLGWHEGTIERAAVKTGYHQITKYLEVNRASWRRMWV